MKRIIATRLLLVLDGLANRLRPAVATQKPKASASNILASGLKSARPAPAAGWAAPSAAATGIGPIGSYLKQMLAEWINYFPSDVVRCIRAATAEQIASIYCAFDGFRTLV